MKKNLPIGQGHGIAGRYAGLPDPYASRTSSKIVILPVPFDKTSTYQKGSDKGPKALIEASRNLELYDIETETSVYEWGIHTDKPVAAKTSKMMLKMVYNRVKEWIAQGKFVVTLGGEHAISYAPILAYAEHYGSLSVLQLDAHADLQEAYENNPWSHASVMARVKEIPQVEKIVSVGIRSMSAEELPFLVKEDTFFAHELESNRVWMNQVIEQLTDPVYVTFDLDVFDSSLMPSTGTPEPGGLSWNTAMKLLKKVAETRSIVGLDVVELCPHPTHRAPDYLAAKLVYKILSYKYQTKKK